MDDVVSERTAPRGAVARLVACAAVVLLSLSATAAAATPTRAHEAKKAPPKVVKPGDPGSSQYQEDVPSAFGSVPATSVTPRLAHPSGPSLPHAVANQLSNAGASGRAAAALAVAGTPQVSTSQAPRSRRRSHSSATGAGSSTGGSSSSGGAPGSAGNGASALAQAGSGRGIAGAVTHSLVGSGGGIGVLLPVLLGASVLIAAAIAMQRRRRSE